MMKKFAIFVALMVTCTYLAIAVENTLRSCEETQETYVCKRCDGTGLEPSMTRTCQSCNGRGKVTESNYCGTCNGSGTVTDKYGDRVTCPTCNGQRMFIKEFQCGSCGGRGETRMTCMGCHGSGKVNR